MYTPSRFCIIEYASLVGKMYKFRYNPWNNLEK